MPASKARITRAISTVVAILVLVVAVPPAALAETEAVWTRWVSEVAKRPSKAEIPFAILISIPAMIVVTPFWLGMVAVEKIRGED